MESLIKWVVKEGLSGDVYDIICFLGGVIGLIFSLFHGKKYRIPMWKTFLTLAFVFGGMYALRSGVWEILKIMKQNNFLGITKISDSIVRVFVFVPFLTWVMARVFKYKWARVCDAIAMFPLLMTAAVQPACLFTGCCRGYELGWGIYNPVTRGYHFPTPILEMVLSFAVFGYLVYRAHKKKYVPDGTQLPLMMAMYGAVRWLCEMLRDNQKLFLGQSGVGIHSIIVCLVGVLVFLYLKNKPVTAEDIAVESHVPKWAEETEATEKSAEFAPVDCAAEPTEAANKVNYNRIRKNHSKRKTKIKKKKRKK